MDTVRTEEVSFQVIAPATVEADPKYYARILPPMTGGIVAVHVQLGDAVRKGQELVTMNSPDYTAAEQNYIIADHNIKRQRDLSANGIAAARDLQQAEADYNIAVGRLRLLGIAPNITATDGPLAVRSPIAGRIVEFNVAQGNYLNDLTAPMMAVADLSTVWLTANVKEKDIHCIYKDQHVKAVFAAYPNETFEGKVLFIADVLDPDTRTVKVRIAFRNDDRRLKPGMFATVAFTCAPVNAIVVPVSSIVQIKDSSYVFKEIALDKYQQCPVVTSSQNGDKIVIEKGLEPDAVIISSNGVLFQ